MAIEKTLIRPTTRPKQTILIQRQEYMTAMIPEMTIMILKLRPNRLREAKISFLKKKNQMKIKFNIPKALLSMKFCPIPRLQATNLLN